MNRTELANQVIAQRQIIDFLQKDNDRLRRKLAGIEPQTEEEQEESAVNTYLGRLRVPW